MVLNPKPFSASPENGSMWFFKAVYFYRFKNKTKKIKTLRISKK